ncbi:MAG: hypothetical protein HOV94_41375 [Saccharothrix sp.]|nr:hypothetical protein [Saccharothrix sp.]
MSRIWIDETSDTPIVIDHEDDDGGDEEFETHVHVTIYRADDTRVTASSAVDGEATPDQVARLILQAALGAAAAHGTDTWIALQALTTGSST